MINFYDNPDNGILHFRASAGGGDGNSSLYDAPATKADIDSNPVEYKDYLKLKANGSVQLVEKPGDIVSRDLHIANLEGQLRTARAEIESLNARIRELEDN